MLGSGLLLAPWPPAWLPRELAPPGTEAEASGPGCLGKQVRE